jgi:undecaprenyl-diphosphatase
LTGVAAIGAASFVMNQPMKYLGRRCGRTASTRRRAAVGTDADVDVVPLRHSASAAAFTVAVGDVVPALRVPLAAAAEQAFSRVYTGSTTSLTCWSAWPRGLLGRLASRLGEQLASCDEGQAWSPARSRR